MVVAAVGPHGAEEVQRGPVRRLPLHVHRRQEPRHLSPKLKDDTINKTNIINNKTDDSVAHTTPRTLPGGTHLLPPAVKNNNNTIQIIVIV